MRLEMTIEVARGLAAQCWCDDRTSGTIMDPILAEVFAELICVLCDAGAKGFAAVAARMAVIEAKLDNAAQMPID